MSEFWAPHFWPDVAVIGQGGLLKELELVEVEDDQMSGAEDGHQNTHAAEHQRAQGPAQGPPGAQEEEGEEVNSWGQRGQRDSCKHKTSENQSDICQSGT